MSIFRVLTNALNLVSVCVCVCACVPAPGPCVDLLAPKTCFTSSCETHPFVQEKCVCPDNVGHGLNIKSSQRTHMHRHAR